MIWLYGYIVFGLINVSVFALRRGFTSVPEVAFYLFGWPLQLLFWTLIWVHNGIEWMYSKLAGE